MNKIIKISTNTFPIILMIACIPFVKNDYFLTLIFMLIIGISFFIQYHKNDIIFFLFGCIVMTISEYLFISTGVETFVRNSLFGIMPLWLPFLWAYGFVAIVRSVKILEK
jgi:hypothetical protein